MHNPDFATPEQRAVRLARKWLPRVFIAAAIPATLAVCYALPVLGVLLTAVLCVLAWRFAMPVGGGSGTGGLAALGDIAAITLVVVVVGTVAATTLFGLLGS